MRLSVTLYICSVVRTVSERIRYRQTSVDRHTGRTTDGFREAVLSHRGDQTKGRQNRLIQTDMPTNRKTDNQTDRETTECCGQAGRPHAYPATESKS